MAKMSATAWGDIIQACQEEADKRDAEEVKRLISDGMNRQDAYRRVYFPHGTPDQISKLYDAYNDIYGRWPRL